MCGGIYICWDRLAAVRICIVPYYACCVCYGCGGRCGVLCVCVDVMYVLCEFYVLCVLYIVCVSIYIWVSYMNLYIGGAFLLFTK